MMRYRLLDELQRDRLDFKDYFVLQGLCLRSAETLMSLEERQVWANWFVAPNELTPFARSLDGEDFWCLWTPKSDPTGVRETEGAPVVYLCADREVTLVSVSIQDFLSLLTIPIDLRRRVVDLVKGAARSGIAVEPGWQGALERYTAWSAARGISATDEMHEDAAGGFPARGERGAATNGAFREWWDANVPW